MQTTLPAIPSDAQLLVMTSARLASLYRDVYRAVRALPESAQWEYGWMIRRVLAAYHVAEESK